MLTLVTPLWLCGLLLLPLIRWLHRGGQHRRTVAVSHLGLWRGSAVNAPAAGERRPPDPAWRRRALLTALLFVALAQPQLPGQRNSVTLWVDDSLSMLTREGPAIRLAEAVAQARTLLSPLAQPDIEVRALSDPWRRLGTADEATVATLVAGAGRRPPSVPPAALLRADRQHWLLTDGAHAALFEWPGGRRPDRLVQAGSVVRNVGLERLSARRNLDDPERMDLLLKVTNGGTASETRTVAFSTDAGVLTHSTHQLDPGATVLVRATIAASTRAAATLQPGDALAEDDEIVVDLAGLRRQRVATDPRCPAALVSAVATHPALAVAPENATDAAAALDCGSQAAAAALATIRVAADRLPAPLPGALLWSSSMPESRRIRLDAQGLRLGARLQAGPTDTELLAAGGEPVIISRAGASKRIETSLDFTSPESARGSQTPLLVNLMFDHLLGSRLLDAIVITDRGPAAARVVPSRPAPTDAKPAPDATAPKATPVLRDGSWPVLLAACLVLLWEIVALARHSWRLRPYIEGRLL